MKYTFLKKAAAISLAAVLTVGLAACTNEETPTESTAGVPDVTIGPVDPTVEIQQAADPQEATEDTEASTVETEAEGDLPESLIQINPVRVRDMSQALMETLIKENPGTELVRNSIPMLYLDSREALDEKLNLWGSQNLMVSCEEYRERFFQYYGLIAVPLGSTTGSLQFEMEWIKEDGALVGEINVKVPDVQTMDMTNFILLIPVAKSDLADNTLAVRFVPNGSFHLPDSQKPVSGLANE